MRQTMAMAENSDKKYCVMDHANKRGDRNAVNPNRAARRRVADRWPTSSERQVRSTDRDGASAPGEE